MIAFPARVWVWLATVAPATQYEKLAGSYPGAGPGGE
jgi:hypothetical protein